MKNKFITVILFLSTVFAQISVDQIRNLTNQQLDQVKSELQSQTEASIVQTGTSTPQNSSPVDITSTAVSLMTEDFLL